MFGFKPQALFALASSPSFQRSCRLSSCSNNSFNPVSFHNRFANAGSCIWKRSFTRTASPRFGLFGVVVNGSDERKFMYVVHNVDVKKREIVKIWCGSTNSSCSSVEGINGFRGGQSGALGTEVGVAVLITSLPVAVVAFLALTGFGIFRVPLQESVQNAVKSPC